MPSTIPYDPSLELGNIVPSSKLALLEDIAKLQAPVDAAEQALNEAILMLRSLDLTIMELSNLGIDAKDVIAKRGDAEAAVAKAAVDLATQRITALAAIAPKRSDLVAITDSIESPIDYNRTQIKKMPLSADSLKMDAQYFSFDEDAQGSDSSVSSISSFVSAATSVLGTKRSAEVTAAVNQQVSQQREHHDVQGTLIITATCTHKDAALLAPFFIDVDKAIRVWNTVFTDEKDKIKPDDVASIQQIAKRADTKDEPKLTILSGATYGSSFVGMVHVLRVEDTTVSQTMRSVAASLQGQMEVGSWFAHASGGFGIDSQFASDAKRMLSTQTISSHCSLVTMGTIPSIKANEVQVGVKQLADFDPAKMMDKLATLANATASQQASVAQGAQAARTGAQMVQIRSAEIQSVMTGLGQIDDGKNKMLDVNSLMTAFEDYIDKALGGNAGVPINYYLKPITASQLAQGWIAKYIPGEYVTSAMDDEKPQEPGDGSKS